MVSSYLISCLKNKKESNLLNLEHYIKLLNGLSLRSLIISKVRTCFRDFEKLAFIKNQHFLKIIKFR